MNDIVWYKCNNFGHISRDCRTQVSHLGPWYGNNVIVYEICDNMGHTTRFCRMNMSTIEGIWTTIEGMKITVTIKEKL